MELLREAAGMVPGLEKMAFRSWPETTINFTI